MFAVPDALKGLPTFLSCLRVLKMIRLCFWKLEDVSTVLGLIRSSPYLQKLHIGAWININSSLWLNESTIAETFISLQLHPDFALDQLQEVTLENFNGTWPEVEIAKFLLAKSSALKKMLIELPVDIYIEVQLKILKMMLRFQRASPKAEIICKDYYECSSLDDHRNIRVQENWTFLCLLACKNV
ncbi:hypothetical protein GH714_040017 [Hevea brasiliensis]|uniref:FBD domain-containing protein n=1 Tax=Hevea brasiliensis TaxID=3981 RepID=A0A6A6MK79_HEVBR|nr:hypothetical protein GH714_040017 [Hevea brasiliensis]